LADSNTFGKAGERVNFIRDRLPKQGVEKRNERWRDKAQDGEEAEFTVCK